MSQGAPILFLKSFIKNVIEETLTLLRSKSKNSILVYTLGSLLNLGIPFLLMPVMTRFLKPEEYGIIASFSILLSLVNPLVNLSTHAYLTNAFYQSEKRVIRSSTLFAGYQVNFALFSGVIISFYFFKESISATFSVPSSVLLIIPFIAVCDCISTSILTIFQITVKPLWYIIFQITRTIINLGCSIYFVVMINLGWEGRILGISLAAFILAILSVFHLKRLIFNDKGGKVDLGEMRSILKFGIPLLPHAFGGIAMSMIDRFWVIHLVGLSEGGIYSLSYQIGSLVGVIETAISQAWQPWLFNKLGSSQGFNKKQVVKATYIYFFFLIICVLVLTCMSLYILPYIIGGQFQDSTKYVGWVALGFAFNGMYKAVVGYLFYQGKTAQLSVVTALCSLMHVFISYFFIYKFGTIGASLATTISFFLTFIAVWNLSARIYPMPWLNRRISD